MAKSGILCPEPYKNEPKEGTQVTVLDVAAGELLELRG